MMNASSTTSSKICIRNCDVERIHKMLEEFKNKLDKLYSNVELQLVDEPLLSGNYFIKVMLDYDVWEVPAPVLDRFVYYLENRDNLEDVNDECDAFLLAWDDYGKIAHKDFAYYFDPSDWFYGSAGSKILYSLTRDSFDDIVEAMFSDDMEGAPYVVIRATIFDSVYPYGDGIAYSIIDIVRIRDVSFFEQLVKECNNETKLASVLFDLFTTFVDDLNGEGSIKFTKKTALAFVKFVNKFDLKTIRGFIELYAHLFDEFDDTKFIAFLQDPFQFAAKTGVVPVRAETYRWSDTVTVVFYDKRDGYEISINFSKDVLKFKLIAVLLALFHV